MNKVEVYGADWCADTQQTLKHLDSLGVAYDYVDLEQNEEAARWVRQQNEGKERKPTVKVGAQILSAPSERELENLLREQGVIES